MFHDSTTITHNTNLPSLKDAWQDHQRVGKPAITTFGDLGITDLPAQATCVAYLDVPQNHPGIIEPDNRYKFDNIDLDRLFNFVTFREWSRHEMDPRLGIALEGGSGNGKTSFLQQRLAQRGIPFRSVVARPGMETFDLIMTKEVAAGTTYWQEGELLLAMLEGIPFIIDEVNRLSPAEFTALNEIIEKGVVTRPDDKTVVHAKRGFMVFVTCNGTLAGHGLENFAGARRQDSSTGNRFLRYRMPFPSIEKEAECILSVHPEIGLDLARQMATFADYTRKAASEDGVEGHYLAQECTRRHLLIWADLIKGMAYLRNQGIDVARYTLDFTYSGDLPAEEKLAVDHFMELAFNTL